MCDDTPYTLVPNDCPFNSQDCIVLVTSLTYHFSKGSAVSCPFVINKR